MNDLRLIDETFLSHFPSPKRHIVTGQFQFRTLTGKRSPKAIVDCIVSDWDKRAFRLLSVAEGQTYSTFRQLLKTYRAEGEEYAASLLLARKLGK